MSPNASAAVPAQRASSDAVVHTVPLNLPTPRRDGAPAALAAVVDLAQDWAKDAACVRVDPDELFVQGAAQHRAKTVCLGCPVRTECLSDALDNRVEFGVWGGMTERERRALLKRRPDVSSWKRLLEAARREHLARSGRQAV